MASSPSFFFLVSFLVLISKNNAAFEVQTTGFMINNDDEICKQARNPSLCLTNLLTSSDSPASSSSNSDLLTLGLIATIQQAEASAKSTQSLINVLMKPITTTSPVIQTIYDTCWEDYSGALDSIDSCKKSLASRDFESLNSFASAIITDAISCDQGFEDEIVHEPPKLIEASRELGDLADVISLISNKLAGK